METEEIKDICQKLNLAPSKSAGQNFLISAAVVDKIVATANLKKTDIVLEVGPGLGVLTEKLAEKAGKVLAVEWDKRLAEYLTMKFRGSVDKNSAAGAAKLGAAKNIPEIIQNDILRVNLAALGLNDFDYKVAANLPYNITAKFLRQRLEKSPKPTEMILMVQKEVAERLTAKLGEMSLLALSAQFYGEPEILFLVGRENFWPMPKVDSAVIKIKIKKKLPLMPDGRPVDEKKMFWLMHIGFSAKRKQLHNNLTAGLKAAARAGQASRIGQINPEKALKIKEILVSLGLSEKIRAQELSLENWLALCHNII